MMDHATQPARAPLSRTAQWAVLGALLAGAVILAGLVDAWHGATATDAPEPPAAPGTFRPTKAQLAALKIAPVAARAFRTEIVTDGVIAVDDELSTPVFAPYSGRVVRLIAKPGDVVSQGQPLFALDAAEFVQGQNDLTVALANLASTRQLLQVARDSEQRQRALYESKAGALKDWQQAEADLATAEANARTAVIALDAVRNRLRILGKSEKDIAALERAGPMRAETVVGAPIAGTVTQRQVGVGQYIQSGASTPQYTIADLSTVWLIANVRETDAPAIRLGQRVEAHALAFPERSFDARISYVGAAVDPATRRIPVRAELDNRDGLLKPAMFASFSIITAPDAQAPGVPAEALVYEGPAARVWVARDDGSIELRQVSTGRTTGGMVEITAGLKAGERIVTSGALFIDRAATAD